jgi:hypothetical protein
LDVNDSDGALTLSAARMGMPTWEASDIACPAGAPWHCIGGTIKQLATGYWQMHRLKNCFQAKKLQFAHAKSVQRGVRRCLFHLPDIQNSAAICSY